MPDEKTVVLSSAEWQQLVAILANATGYLTFQKLVGQLQAQDRPPVPAMKPGDGVDRDLPESLRRMTQP